jgi:8-oxo-dGTP diphosphatase
MTYDNRFKIRVAVILPMQGQLLVCQQNQHPFWVLPGGTLEPGEGVEACAIREVQEEMGLTITLSKLLYVTDWITPTRQVHELYFLGVHQAGQLQQGREANIQQVQLVDPLNLPDKRPLQPALVAQALQQHWPTGFVHVQGHILGTYR